MFPDWLHSLSWIALAIGGVSALVIALDVARHPQHMGVMNVVWPTALFGGPLTLWLYFRYGRLATQVKMHAAMQRHETPPSKTDTPFAIMVAKGASHCGSGCMLGDIAAEWLAFLVPGIALGLGWTTLFADKMFAVWVLDFAFAFLLGIVFQYFAIVPMRGLSPGEGILAALKADTLSLVSWQVGMYGFMAFAQLYLLGHLLGQGRRRHARVLVHDADRDGGRFRDGLSGQLVADQQRHQGTDVKLGHNPVRARRPRQWCSTRSSSHPWAAPYRTIAARDRSPSFSAARAL